MPRKKTTASPPSANLAQMTSESSLREISHRARIELARRNLADYVEYVHGFKTFPHQQEWVNALDSLTPTAPHLLIIAPPGSSKTSWMGIFNPAYQIGVNPNLHIGYISNSATQAHKQSIAVRDTLTTKEYLEVFPGIRPDFRKGWSKDKWNISRQDASDNNPTLDRKSTRLNSSHP